MILASRRARLVRVVFAAAAIGGALVAWRYHTLGLSLSHYDARGHLVVARRIFDSLTPGWQQIGAVWLPLPHLLNAVPVQIDAFYRSGASAIAISILSFAVTTAAIAWIAASVTNSMAAGLAAAAVFAFNPNVLYLQATPMTEPLLVALVFGAIALLMAWCEANVTATGVESGFSRILTATARGNVRLKPDATTARVGCAFALACLTRYEAWPVMGAALVVAVWVLWRQGRSFRLAMSDVAAVAIYPAGAIISFLIFSRIVGGAWFANDFFVPENPAQGRPLIAIDEIVWGVRELSGYGVLIAGIAGLAMVAVMAIVQRQRAHALLALTASAMAAVPFIAFVEGHPYRIRYMVPLVAVEAVLAGLAAGWFPRARTVAVSLVVLLVAMELRPLDVSAPMVVEAQWDRPSARERQRVSACLGEQYDGLTVMASMGSLGHYMQELSAQGFALRDFLHEGNGDIWLSALEGPRPYVGWMLIEEKAEGGDMLAQRTRENPSFVDGFSRVCEGAGVALYRRDRQPLHEAAKSEY